MQYIITTLLVLAGHLLFAQSKINQSFDASSAKKINLYFKYPELVKIVSWDKNEVLITGTVNINNGENDANFKLKPSAANGELTVSSEIEGLEDLPERITIKKNGTVYTFNTSDWNSPEIRKFLDEHGSEHEYISRGVFHEIKLEVFVPRNVALEAEAKYGLIELSGLQGPAKITAKYGGIDINIPDGSKADMVARTKYGEIFTNLELSVEAAPEIYEDKWMVVSARLNGGGSTLDLESKYGNVYIRRQQK